MCAAQVRSSDQPQCRLWKASWVLGPKRRSKCKFISLLRRRRVWKYMSLDTILSSFSRSAAQGVSFEIPFDKESTNQKSPDRGMTRSVSTEGFGFKMPHGTRGIKRNLSFQPINGKNMGIEEEGCPDSLSGNHNGRLNGSGPPSIEEALEIIPQLREEAPEPQGPCAQWRLLSSPSE